MNKTELIAAVAEQASMTKADARKAVDAIINTTKAELKKGNNIALIGFGTFSTVKRAAHKGINPATGKSIKIKAKTVAKFKASKTLI